MQSLDLIKRHATFAILLASNKKNRSRIAIQISRLKFSQAESCKLLLSLVANQRVLLLACISRIPTRMQLVEVSSMFAYVFSMRIKSYNNGSQVIEQVAGFTLKPSYTEADSLVVAHVFLFLFFFLFLFRLQCDCCICLCKFLAQTFLAKLSPIFEVAF